METRECARFWGWRGQGLNARTHTRTTTRRAFQRSPGTHWPRHSRFATQKVRLFHVVTIYVAFSNSYKTAGADIFYTQGDDRHLASLPHGYAARNQMANPRQPSLGEDMPVRDS
jgi:hypothetical protein